ncbi:hypothetical protein AQS70_22370 [Pseudomonas endophytica]|uniref:Uncharacterized protein n=1 Tax=Pseudomonas endophytica TaxID=1563157 RepID=A0A0N8VST7_9PSED|nr:hypothetical protein [Pseudomonas endophytica]KQB54236.1 hypothetical protein AQS70_22370 [Pseudomonas endophytica]
MIMNQKQIFELSYNMIENFISIFNKKNLTELETKYGMTPAIYNEAREYLDDYFGNENYQLKPPPKKGNPPHLLEDNILDIYGADEDTDCWRINCKLFSEQGEEEISANFDLFHDSGQFKLKYLYTAS